MVRGRRLRASGARFGLPETSWFRRVVGKMWAALDKPQAGRVSVKPLRYWFSSPIFGRS